MLKKVKIKVLPEKKEFESLTTENLLHSLISNGVNIYASCGGKGNCGKCKVKILLGKYFTAETRFISENEKKQNIVLACLTVPESDLTIEVLQEAKLEYIKTLEDQTSVYIENINPAHILEKNCWGKSPPLKIIKPKIDPPSLNNPTADFERIEKELAENGIENVKFNNFSFLRELPEKLRNNNWEIKMLLLENIYKDKIEHELVDVLSISENEEYYGLAVDIGTTTVAVSLINLTTLETVATRTSLNQQRVYGDDVITRIIYSENPQGLYELNQKIVNTINQLIDVISEQAKVPLKDIYTMVVAGNTTMIHLFYSIPPKYVRREPYVPVISQIPPMHAKEVGIMINPNGIIYSFPSVASYVGGDIVAGIISCGIDMKEKISLLLDLGTNGEIAIGNKDFIICAACSIGPAFEGVDISCGIYATVGAIEDVEIKNGDVIYKVIGDVKPIGICGSGLISIPAVLYFNGIIDRAGKFIKQSDTKHNSKLYNRVRINNEGEYEFVIAEKTETANNKDIVITESDINNILRSKGALFHGVYTLLNHLNLKFEDNDKIYISGGFGSFIDIHKAQVLGLFPDLPKEKFVVVGNSSLLGAKLFLYSQDVRKKVAAVAQKMTYIDLSSDPMFMNEYTSTLFIPHTNLGLFPNVSKIFNL